MTTKNEPKMTPASEERVIGDPVMEQKTDQTGQDEQTADNVPATREPYIEMAMSDEGEWSWCLWASNGRALAVSASTFTRRNDCQKNINAALECFRMPKLKIVAAI